MRCSKKGVFGDLRSVFSEMEIKGVFRESMLIQY